MALSGDLRNVRLADIFQTLAMNRQVGLLVLRKGAVEKRVYFSGSGVSLFSRRTIQGFRLGRHLVGAGKLTEEQLTQALEHQERRKTMLGEVLVELGFCHPEDIEAIVRYHVAEEIYELFTWQQGSFEFLEAECPEASPEATPFSTVSFEPGGLVMEAARRIDEWDRIHLALPDEEACLAQTGTEGPALDSETYGYDVAGVYALVNGRRSVREIYDDYYLARFETASILSELARDGLVRMSTFEEMSAEADRCMAESEWASAIRLLRHARELRPDEPRVLERLVTIYEGQNSRREAAEVLFALGSLLVVKGRTAEAVNLLEKSSKLDPVSPDPPQLLSGLFRDCGDLARSVEYTIQAAQNHIARQRPEAAEELCRQAVPLAPGHPGLRTTFANACIELRDTAAALEHLEEAGRIYEALGDLHRFSEVAKKILQLDPGREEVENRLALLARGRRRQRARRLALLCGGGVGLAVLLLSLLVFSRGIDAEEHIGEAWKLLQGGDLKGAERIANAVIEADPESDAALNARNVLSAVLRRRGQHGQASQREKADLDHRLRAAFTPARDAFAAHDYREGFEHLVKFAELLTSADTVKLLAKLAKNDAKKFRDEFWSGSQALLEMYAQANDADAQRMTSAMWTLRQAKDGKLGRQERVGLCASTEALCRDTAVEDRKRNLAAAEIVEVKLSAGERRLSQRIAKSTDTIVELGEEAAALYHHYRAPLLRDELFDCFTATRQSVAESLIQGQFEPAREACIAFLSECRKLEAEQPADVYAPVVGELLGKRGLDLDGKVRRDFETIEKVLEQIAAAEALVAQDRIAEANDIFVSLVRDHYRLNLRDRVRLAIRVESVPLGASLSLLREGEPPRELGAIGATGVLVRYPAWGTTTISATRNTFRPASLELREDAKTRPAKIVLRMDKIPDWTSEEGGPVQASPTPEGDAILLPSRDGHVRAFDRDTGRVLFDHDARLLSGLEGTPVVAGRLAIFRSPDTAIMAFDLDKKQMAWTFRADSPVSVDPVQVAGLTVVADEGGLAYAVRDGVEVWRARLSGPVKAAVAAGADAVYLATTEARVHCLDVATGRARWERELGAPVFTGLATSGGAVLVGTEAADLLSLSTTDGRVVWRHMAENAIRGTPAVDGGAVWIATVAGTISRIDLATGSVLGRFETASRAPFDAGVTVSRDFAYAVDTAGMLIALDKDARQIWSYDLNGPVRHPPAIAGERIFVASERGRFFCFSESR